MDLPFLDVIALICSSKVRDVYNIRPKSFVMKLVELVYYERKLVDVQPF